MHLIASIVRSRTVSSEAEGESCSKNVNGCCASCSDTEGGTSLHPDRACLDGSPASACREAEYDLMPTGATAMPDRGLSALLQWRSLGNRVICCTKGSVGFQLHVRCHYGNMFHPHRFGKNRDHQYPALFRAQ